MPHLRLAFRSIVLVSAALFFGATCQCQIISVGDDTSTPIEGAGHDYIKALAETVNPANGSVSLRIQASPAKGRGITLPFSFNYDSNGVNHFVPQGIAVSALSNQTWVSQGGGPIPCLRLPQAIGPLHFHTGTTAR